MDSPNTFRLLKEHGVQVYFAEQSIYTLGSKGELLLTAMSSPAQEESRFISETGTWGQRKRSAVGKVSMSRCDTVGCMRVSFYSIEWCGF